MKSLKLILICSMLFMVGCSNASSTQTESVDTMTQDTTIAPLLVYGEAKVDEIEELQLDFPARIVDVDVKKGSLVKKGDILLTLDYTDYQLQINTLEKELEGYEAELIGLQNSSNVYIANLDALSKDLALKKGYLNSEQDPDILPLKNTLSTLNEDLEQAKDVYASNKSLFEVGALSEYELTQSKLAYEKLEQQIKDTTTAIQKIQDARKIEVSKLQSSLNEATLQVSNTDVTKASQITQLQAKIESIQLNLQNLKSKLNAPHLKNKQLIAPKDNLIIYNINTSSGSFVSGLGQPVIQFMDLNTMYVSIDIPEESLSQVSLGAPVTLKIADKDVTQPIIGAISTISNFATEKDGDTIVEADVKITSGTQYLKPGLSIDAYIEVCPD